MISTTGTSLFALLQYNFYISIFPMNWVDNIAEQIVNKANMPRTTLGSGNTWFTLSNKDIKINFTYMVLSKSTHMYQAFITFSLPNKLLSAKLFVCFIFQSASMLLKVSENVIWVSNSLDLGEMLSNLASHPDQSCLLIIKLQLCLAG